MKSSKPVPEKVTKVTARRKTTAKEAVVDEVFPELMIVGTNIAKNKSYYPMASFCEFLIDSRDQPSFFFTSHRYGDLL